MYCPNILYGNDFIISRPHVPGPQAGGSVLWSEQKKRRNCPQLYKSTSITYRLLEIESAQYLRNTVKNGPQKSLDIKKKKKN